MNILIVDDEPNARKTMSKILKAKGFEVREAGTGAQAVACCGAEFFNLVLMDMQLPDMNGLEVLKRVRAINADTISIMMTAYASLDSSIEAMNNGAYSYIIKPVNMDAALAVIDKGLEKQRLEQASRQLAAIVESSIDAIIGASLDGIIISWNKGAEKLYGYTGAEVIGKSLTILVPSHQSGEISSILDRVRRNEPIQHYETIRQAKNGRLVDVSVTISPVKDLGGRIVGASGIVRDITELKKQNEKILQLSQAVESSPASIEITDSTGLLEYVNPKYLEVTGYGLNEVIGKNPSILKSGEHPQEFYADLWGTITKGDVWKGELHNRKKNGELFWEAASISSIKDPKGNITHYVAVKDDITDRKSLESAYKEAEIKIAEALVVKSEFISMVSHELRTPLTIIKESLSIVYDEIAGPINAQQKDFLVTAKNNVDRLARLINDVLDYQKLETPSKGFEMAEQSINDIVGTVGQGFRVPLARKNIVLNMQLQGDLPKASIDKDKIIQVLTNLMNNAMKFTDKGTISLKTETLGDNAVKVSVKDAGIGIKESDLSKLFKSFSQISTGKERKTGGSGLGLVLCKKIIEAHGGKIGVESVFGQGSVFYFVLPVRERRL